MLHWCGEDWRDEVQMEAKGKGKGCANDGKLKCKDENKSDPEDEEAYLQSWAAIVGDAEEDTQEILSNEGEDKATATANDIGQEDLGPHMKVGNSMELDNITNEDLVIKPQQNPAIQKEKDYARAVKKERAQWSMLKRVMIHVSGKWMSNLYCNRFIPTNPSQYYAWAMVYRKECK